MSTEPIQPCDACEGTGIWYQPVSPRVDDTEQPRAPCPYCRGEGYTTEADRERWHADGCPRVNTPASEAHPTRDLTNGRDRDS